MRIIPNHIALLCLCLIAFSCERERIYPYKHHTPLISLHSIFEVGKNLEVKLEQTSNISGSQEEGQNISSASFKILWNESIFQFDSLFSNNGTFIFPDIIPSAGDALTIIAQSGKLSVRSEIRIPSKSLTQLNGLSVDESNLNPLITAQLSLDGAEKATGPFIIYATGILQDPISGRLEKKRFQVKSSHSFIDQRTQSLAELPSDLLFIPMLNASDLDFTLVVSGIPATFSPVHPKQSLELVIEKLSPALYEYYLSLFLAFELEDSEYTSEPFEVHSNVTGGVGVLGAYHRTRLSLYW